MREHKRLPPGWIACRAIAVHAASRARSSKGCGNASGRPTGRCCWRSSGRFALGRGAWFGRRRVAAARRSHRVPVRRGAEEHCARRSSRACCSRPRSPAAAAAGADLPPAQLVLSACWLRGWLARLLDDPVFAVVATDHHSDRPMNTATDQAGHRLGIRSAESSMIAPARGSPRTRRARGIVAASVPPHQQHGQRTHEHRPDRLRRAITTMLFDSAKAPITASKLNEASSTLR